VHAIDNAIPWIHKMQTARHLDTILLYYM